MNAHRNPCGLCGDFDHLTVECIRYEEHDTVAEAAVVRPAYVPSAEYATWLAEIDEARSWDFSETLGKHPLSRRAA